MCASASHLEPLLSSPDAAAAPGTCRDAHPGWRRRITSVLCGAEVRDSMEGVPDGGA